MSINRFNLTSDFDADDFQGGSIDIHIGDIKHDNLEADMPVKTNGDQVLYSTLLTTSDISDIGTNFIEKGGTTDGADLTLGTLDDNKVIFKQNGHEQMELANNQLSVCVCQSQAVVWDDTSKNTTGIIPDTTFGGGRVKLANSNSTSKVYTSDTFDPTSYDYDIVFNITYASKFATNPSDVSSKRLGIHFMTDQVDAYDLPINGTIIELMNDDPNPQILHDTYTDNIASLGGAYVIKLEIRNQLGYWYKDDVLYTTANPIVLDQPLYYVGIRDTSAGTTTAYDITVTWSIPGHQLEVNTDSIKMKVPLVITDNLTNAYKIMDDAGNSYVEMDTTLNKIKFLQTTEYNGNEVLTHNGNALGETLVKGTTDNNDVKIIRNSVDTIHITSDEHKIIIPDLKSNGLRITDGSQDYIRVNSSTNTVILDEKTDYLGGSGNNLGEIVAMNYADLELVNVGGNTLGAGFSLGTTDNFDVDLIRNNVNQIELNSTGVDVKTDLTVSGGYIQLSDTAAPLNPSAGEGRLYKKTGDAGLFWKPDAAGAEVELSNGTNKVTKGGDTDGVGLTIGTTDNFDVDLIRNNVNQIELNSTGVDVKTDLTVSADFKYNRGVTEVYVNQSTQSVTLTNSDTWYDIQYESNTGTIVTEYNSGDFTITVTDPNVDGTQRVVQIKYTGTRTRRAHCGISLSFKGDTNNKTYHFSAWKYDDSAGLASIVPASEQKVGYTGGASQWRSLACHFMLELDTNDYFYLRVEEVGGSGGTKVTVEDCNYFAIILPNVI